MKNFCLVLDLDQTRNSLGKTDFDLFHQDLLNILERMIAMLWNPKKPMLNILELVFNSQGLPDWFLTNKYPLINKKGDAIELWGQSGHMQIKIIYQKLEI